MADLIFREKDHIYLLGGKPLPCVSELCAPLHRAVYQDAPKWQMEEAALRGTAVHAATQALDAAGTAEIQEEYSPYILAYRDFLRDFAPSWVLTEQPLFHPEYLYAGTPDRYGLLSGKHTLLDVKTTYRVYKPLCRGQLNLYRLLLMARGFPVEKMVILHLRRDGTYRLIPIPQDEPLAIALITIHNALPKRRKKGDSYV